MNLHKLINSACNSNKLSQTEVIDMLTAQIDEREDKGKLYEAIYKKAYGNTISDELADMIIRGFAVTDNSGRDDGMKWTKDQTVSVGNDIGIDWGKIPKNNWWIVMNMMASDFVSLSKKLEYQDDPKFYAYLAKDWLEDQDISNKLFKYIFHVIM